MLIYHGMCIASVQSVHCLAVDSVRIVHADLNHILKYTLLQTREEGEDLLM